MFEHMKNYEKLLKKIPSWLKLDGVISMLPYSIRKRVLNGGISGLCRGPKTHVREKQTGAHVLSRNVSETRSLSGVFPDWKEQNAPVKVPVTNDKFWFVTEKRALHLPSPLNNEGNVVRSLSQLVRWIKAKAEELGVEVYPGFAKSEDLYEDNRVVGIATSDMGVAKDGFKKSIFQRGIQAGILLEKAAGVLCLRPSSRSFNFGSKQMRSTKHMLLGLRRYGRLSRGSIKLVKSFTERQIFCLPHGQSAGCHWSRGSHGLHEPVF